MNTPRTIVSAEDRVIFGEAKPVVHARSGYLCGHRFRLSALTVKVHATTQDDGTVRISTTLRPEVEACTLNPDGLTSSDWRFLTLDEDQMPSELEGVHAALVSAVYAMHPLLRYADSPIARANEIGVPA